MAQNLLMKSSKEAKSTIKWFKPRVAYRLGWNQSEFKDGNDFYL